MPFQRLHVGAKRALIGAEGDSKMIRIQTADNPGGITIAIDGQLAGEYVEEVETSIRKAASEQRKNVHLFLRDISHIDETGHSLLSRLAAQGVELSASGLYSSYVVTQIQRAQSSRQSRGT
jgi:ABC-type transporter Mla MlaB component